MAAENGLSSESLTQLFNAERDQLVHAVRRLVGCEWTAEDIVQDTLLRLWGKRLGHKDRGLLFTTARNLAIDHIRAHRVRQDYARAIAAGADACSGDRPDENVGSQEELAGLVRALAELPERAQRVFLLNRLDGLSYRKIARQLQVSVSTVEKDMIRALTVCRQWERNRRDAE